MLVHLYEDNFVQKSRLSVGSRGHGLFERINIPYEIKNVTTNPAYAKELKAASGQCLSPSVDVDGKMLADASVEDVAKALEEREIII